MRGAEKALAFTGQRFFLAQFPRSGNIRAMSTTADTNNPPPEESRQLTLSSIETMLHRLNCACDMIRLGHYDEPPVGHIAYLVDQLKDTEEVLLLQPIHKPVQKDYRALCSGLTWKGEHYTPDA
jgi:hypothetical protein